MFILTKRWRIFTYHHINKTTILMQTDFSVNTVAHTFRPNCKQQWMKYHRLIRQSANQENL